MRPTGHAFIRYDDDDAIVEDPRAPWWRLTSTGVLGGLALAFRRGRGYTAVADGAFTGRRLGASSETAAQVAPVMGRNCADPHSCLSSVESGFKANHLPAPTSWAGRQLSPLPLFGVAQHAMRCALGANSTSPSPRHARTG